MEVTPADVYQLITCNEPLHLATLQVRNAADIRAAKASPVALTSLPCGVFTRRNCRSLLKTSGLVVVDIDHLDSLQEAEQMRRTLFDDPFLCPVLCFCKSRRTGVKAFVPYRQEHAADAAQNAAESMYWAMNYVEMAYGGDTQDKPTGKGVDTSGKDIVRACFLCHDPEALFREQKKSSSMPHKSQLINHNMFESLEKLTAAVEAACADIAPSHAGIRTTRHGDSHRLRRRRPGRLPPHLQLLTQVPVVACRPSLHQRPEKRTWQRTPGHSISPGPNSRCGHPRRKSGQRHKNALDAENAVPPFSHTRTRIL